MPAVVGGLELGATFALVGLGLVLAYRATDTINFAHGELMLLGAYVVGRWNARGAYAFIWSVAVSLVIVALLGALLFRAILQRTVGLPPFVPIVATLGFASIADGVMNLIFGSQQYTITIPGAPTGSLHLAGATFGSNGVVLATVSYAIAIGVVLLMRFTGVGMRVRQAGQNALLASQGGTNVRRVYLLSWATAAALAALAGITYGSTNVVNPAMEELAFLALPAILLGGLDSMFGAIVGGVLIGLLQSFISTYWNGAYVSVSTYTVLLLVILVRPQGILGTRQVARV